MKTFLTVAATVVGVVVLVAALVVLVWDTSAGPPSRSPFDSARWKAQSGTGCDRAGLRRTMTGDLLATHLRNGMTESRVLALLGRPERSERRGLVVWWTFETGSDGLDCTTLVVRFVDGIVNHAREGTT